MYRNGACWPLLGDRSGREHGGGEKRGERAEDASGHLATLQFLIFTSEASTPFCASVWRTRLISSSWV